MIKGSKGLAKRILYSRIPCSGLEALLSVRPPGAYHNFASLLLSTGNQPKLRLSPETAKPSPELPSAHSCFTRSGGGLHEPAVATLLLFAGLPLLTNPGPVDLKRGSTPRSHPLRDSQGVPASIVAGCFTIPEASTSRARQHKSSSAAVHSCNTCHSTFECMSRVSSYQQDVGQA